MRLDEEELSGLAQRFRRALKETDYSEESVGLEAHLRMRSFPASCCAEVCTLFGIYVVEDLDLEDLA